MNITLKQKGNVLRMVFFGGLHIEEMTRSDISEECVAQLYWFTDNGVDG